MSDGDDGRSGGGLWIRVRQALQDRASGPPANLSRVDERVHPTKALPRVLRPGGLMMVIFSTSRHDRLVYRKYIIEDGEHLRHRWLPYTRPAQRLLLGRDVERLFAPLEVAESYLLTLDQREMSLRRPKLGEKAEETKWPDRSSRC